jgi:copper chaperone CopZ
VKRVKNALSQLPGVAEVNVDFDNRIAHCKLESEDFDTKAAIDALAAEDFKATVRESVN